MTATYTEARDEMFGMFTDAFGTPAAAVVGAAVEVRYQGKLEQALPDADKYWVRLSTKNVTGRQSAFVTNATGKGSSEHTSRGLIFVEVYAPMSEVDGFEKAGLLAEVAQGIFQNAETSSSVWFRNVRINDLPDDGKSWRFNVVAEYSFDTVKG